MTVRNPFHNQGGRPPLNELKKRFVEILRSEVLSAKKNGLPMRSYRPSDISALYQKQYDKEPDPKTLKKYLQILCDEGKLKAVMLYDNNNRNKRKRRIKYCYEYNMEV